MTPLSPQQRSNLARQAAHARWSKPTAVPSRGPCEEQSAGYTQPQAIPKAHGSKPKAHSTWIDTRFCLSLHQDSAGQWLLRTPSGLELPATNAEISLWLDLQAIKRPA